MLLRSVSKHVKDQNWFAVFIDFFIVVVGILIAFQITNWNSDKQDRVDEQYYLNRIIGDIDESLSNNNDVIIFLQNKIETTYWIVEKLHSGKISEDERAIFKERYQLIGRWRTGDFIDSTIIELQSSGQLDIIQSKSFREHLGRFQLKLAGIRRGQNNITDIHKTLLHEINSRTDRGSKSSEEIFLIQSELLSTFEELSQNKELYRFVERYAFFYQVRLGYVQELLETLNELRETAIVAIENGDAQ